MKYWKGRGFIGSVTALIVLCTLFGVYAVQTTMRQVETALPIAVVNERTELTALTQNLNDLYHSIQILKEFPSNPVHRVTVEKKLNLAKAQLKLVRDSYRLKNLVGAAAFHAVISPALFDVDRWFRLGIYSLPRDSAKVLSLIEQRTGDALAKVKQLDHQANLKALEVLELQSSKIASFRDVATIGLVMFVIGVGWLISLIWSQFTTNKQLVESENRFRDFANITSDYLWETDKDLKTAYLSRRFEELTGVSKTIALGKMFDPSAFTLNKSRFSGSEIKTAFKSGEPIKGLVVQSDAVHGEMKYLQIDGAPVYDINGNMSGYRGGVKDVTDLTNARHLAEEMKSAAESANQAKTDFLANMSHEIRSPIAIISGMTDLIQNSNLNPDQKRYLGIIRDASDSLLNLINRILDVSKIESNKVPLSCVYFDVCEMADSIRDSYKELAGEKDVRISLVISPEVERRKYGDRYRVEQILRNLVDNALKFTDSGEITICIDNDINENKLLFSVTDTGIGIPVDKQEKMFDPFVQEDDAIDRKYGGTGLGLAISRQLANLMGGGLWLQSEKGHGSTFFFTIAFDECPDQLVEYVSLPENQDIKYGDTRPLEILLVEDDEIMAMVVKEYLRQLPHNVHWVDNGRDAVAAFKKSGYDLVFMDISMPGMDGYETVKQMRYLEKTGSDSMTTIAALSASVLSSDVERCHQAGFDFHLPKPINKDELVGVVTEYSASLQ